jgi:general stress protein 26
MPNPNATLDARSFLEAHSLGVIATLSPEGTPRARTVYYVSDDSLAVYFLTLTGTRKVEDIAHDTHAAFVVSAEQGPQTIQLEGTVVNLTDTATVDAIVKKLSQKIEERGSHFAPLTHLDTGKIMLYKLAPSWVRWGDFTHGEGTDTVLTELPV